MTSLIYLSNLGQKLLKPFGFELKFKCKQFLVQKLEEGGQAGNIILLCVNTVLISAPGIELDFIFSNGKHSKNSCLKKAADFFDVALYCQELQDPFYSGKFFTNVYEKGISILLL